MPRRTKKNPDLSPDGEDLDDIQTLKNLLELHTRIKGESSLVNKGLD